MKQELTNTHLKLKRGTQEIANDAKKKKKSLTSVPAFNHEANWIELNWTQDQIKDASCLLANTVPTG